MRKSIIRNSILLLLICVIPLLVQRTGYSYLIGIFVIIAIYGIVIMGYDLRLGFAGQLSFAQIAFFGIGAYGSALMTAKYSLSPILALALALLFSMGVAFIIGHIIMLRLQHIYLAIATLAFGEVFSRFLTGFPSFTGGAIGIYLPPFSVFGFKFDSDIKFYYLACIMALAFFIFSTNIIRSRWGRSLLALNSDEQAARCMGINTAKCKIQVFITSVCYASIAGSFYAHFQNFVVPEQFSVAHSIELILMLFIGGTRTVWGGFIGVTILQVLPEVSEWLADYRPFVSGTLLIVILIFMPKGIVGTLIEFWRDRWAKSSGNRK